MNFDIIAQIERIETIAKRPGIRILHRLQKVYGAGNWRKMKGIAIVQLADKTKCKAEIHWYEAHGIGRKDFKTKEVL
jgi:hypothetical protein